MATEFESPRSRWSRKRRRYRIDESAITVFDGAGNFLRFLPWCDCAGIRSRDHAFSILKRSGAPINGSLASDQVIQFRNEVRLRWRATVPHAYLEWVQKQHRQARCFLLLYGPLLFLSAQGALQAVVSLRASLGMEPDWELITKLPRAGWTSLLGTVAGVVFYFLYVGPRFYLDELGEDMPSMAPSRSTTTMREIQAIASAWFKVVARFLRADPRGLMNGTARA